MESRGFSPFYTCENDLSTRSLNVIEKLGGTEQMLAHYKTFNSFLNIEKSGILVNKELSSYCKYLLRVELQIKPEDIKDITDNEFEFILHIYYNEKTSLNARTQNLLIRLENLEGFEIHFENKKQFIKKYFLEQFDYKKLRNAGIKSIRDLEVFKEVLVNYKEFYKNEKLPEIGNSNGVLDNLYILFDMKFPKHELEFLVDGEYYNFYKTLILYFYNRFNLTQSKVYWHYYFEKEPVSLKEFAKYLICSSELVRTYLKNFETKILSELCSIVKFKVGVCFSDIPIIENTNYLNLDDFDEFEFGKKKYTPNHELSNLIYKCLFEDDLISFDKLILESVVSIKSFKINEVNLFISKKFVKSYEIKNLLNFLNEEINNFETTEFDYNLEILINRYFIENNIEVNKNTIAEINKLILLVRKEDWDLSDFALKKQKKQEYLNTIINTTYEFLNCCKAAQKTKSIVNYLSEKQLLIDRVDLLRLLNSQTGSFVRFGNGLWGLKEWKVALNLRGSIREIVEDILASKDNPVHISELLEIINKLRPISRHSLDSNLRAEEHQVFKFFNCAYIGLKSKKYDEYWNKIPKFTPLHVIKRSIRNQNFKTLFDEIDFISKHYGYPKQHLEFIFSKKLKKSNKN